MPDDALALLRTRDRERSAALLGLALAVVACVAAVAWWVI